MSEKFTSLLAACAVTVAVFAATTPAMAKQRPIIVTGTVQDIPVRYVSYRDLNLAQAGDERLLVTRVRIAVKDVCNESVTYDNGFQSSFMRCRVDSWQGAEPQIGLAVERARQIATNGFSAIAPVAISISAR